ncbi:MAG TPA: glycoside hydrolase family 28 protein [Cyclobacteriaceae bacterium]|nr:glycoside hydrolase family 28 protein [Cyclobacteriaceae bacterium]
MAVVTIEAQNLEWVSKVGSQFNLTSTKIFFVDKYGAVADGKTNNAKSIQKAIDACTKAGGGIVQFKTGSYMTGAIFLKDNVQLQIDKDVLILGSERVEDYPEIDTRIAGIEMKWPSALININGVKNSSVVGEGIVNARGKFNWDLYWRMRKEYDAKGLRWIVDYDAKRVRTLLVQNSSNITIKGLTFKNAGFWTVQLLYSKNITVDGVIIRNNEDGSGPSTDGIDIDSSSWVLIENCDIDCNDDNFCLKAGRDWDGLRVNRPTEYVVIRKCIARRGAGLVTLGSETSGGIRHVLASDLTATHTDNGLRIKSAVTRGGIVEDIYFQNVRMDSINVAFQFNLNWNPSYSYSTLPKGYDSSTVPAHWKVMLNRVEPAEKGIPVAKDIYVNNVTIMNANTAFSGTGLKNSTLKNFNFSKMSIGASSLGAVEYTSGWNFNDFSFSIIPKAVQLKNASGKENEERLK